MPGKTKPKTAKAAPAVKPRTSTTRRRPSSKRATQANATMTASTQLSGKAASRRIDERIRDVGGWRGETLSRMRTLILEAEPEMVEEIKWVKPSNPWGVPVWSYDGIVCTGEIYKEVVKLTFMRGASIPDPSRIFNSSLDGGTRRAIDIRDGANIDPDAFKALVRAAVAANAE